MPIKDYDAITRKIFAIRGESAYRKAQMDIPRLEAEGNSHSAISAYLEEFFVDGRSSEARAAKKAKQKSTPPVDEGIVAKLALAAFHRDSGAVEDVTWVYRNLAMPWDAIRPEDVPSPGAVTLLQFAKDDLATFIKSVWINLMPKRDDITKGQAYKDDGRKLVDFCQQLADQSRAIESERELRFREVMERMANGEDGD